MWTSQQELNNDLLWAARLGNVEEMDDLIVKGAYVNYKDDHGYTPLYETVCKGDIKATQFLLSKGANPNARNYRNETPLFFARTPGLIKTLAEYKVNSLLENQEGNTAYELFFINKKLELIRAWLAAGLQRPRITVNVDKDDLKNVKRCITDMKKIEKQLFTAVAAGDIDQIKYLVKEKGVNVNAANPQGITALMLGSKINNASTVRLLLSLGSDAEKNDYLGRNAIDYAFKYGAELALLELIGYEEEIQDAG